VPGLRASRIAGTGDSRPARVGTAGVRSAGRPGPRRCQWLLV